MRGRFIVVEGLEGAGKSTAIGTIASLLSPLGIELVQTREPGGTGLGETVRQLIKATSTQQPLDPRAELFLFYAARVQLIEHVIRPALNRGAWVLADRFDLSTWAYQGGGRKLDLALISQLSASCLGDMRPDLTLFLDISAEQGLQRVAMRGKMDRIEQEALSFFEDVYSSYQQRLQTTKPLITIDASQPLDTVQCDIRTQLSHYLEQHDLAID